MRRLSSVVLLLLLVVGCEQTPTQRYPNVVKVLMHEPRNFTFVTKESPNAELQFISKGSGNYHFFEDVPDSEPQYAVINYPTGMGFECEIHLHSDAKIAGADWSRDNLADPPRHGHTNVIK